MIDTERARKEIQCRRTRCRPASLTVRVSNGPCQLRRQGARAADVDNALAGYIHIISLDSRLQRTCESLASEEPRCSALRREIVRSLPFGRRLVTKDDRAAQAVSGIYQTSLPKCLLPAFIRPMEPRAPTRRNI
jgi:hypothetical protein